MKFFSEFQDNSMNFKDTYANYLCLVAGSSTNMGSYGFIPWLPYHIFITLTYRLLDFYDRIFNNEG